jgi:nicotinamidase-related amidase
MMPVRKATSLRKSSESFLDFLDSWMSGLPVISMKSLLKKIPAEQTAIACVDVVNGFCKEGNLASPRVGQIVNPIVQLLKNAEQHGINYYVLPQDNHPADSKEFEIYPRHCVEGSVESKTVDEINELPGAYKFKVIPKTTINPGLEHQLQMWLQQNPDVHQFIVTGDCTDLCVYQLAMHLKLQSIKKEEDSDVIVPANCVDTFDIGMEIYRNERISPHPGDLLHAIFLYHLHLNGVRVVARIE